MCMCFFYRLNVFTTLTAVNQGKDPANQQIPHGSDVPTIITVLQPVLTYKTYTVFILRFKRNSCDKKKETVGIAIYKFFKVL